jgi:TolB-like protein/Flp pilus assembly protein TadD
MTETRKRAAILAADIAGYGRITATDEERTIARLRGLRTDLIDPAISVHHGHVIKRTGDGILIEFRSVVDAVRCSIEVQSGMVERNAELPPERRILFRVGIHLGDVIEEADGDLMGDGVNIASRLENICKPGAIFLSDDAYRQVKSGLDLAVTDLGNKELKNIPETVRVVAIEVGQPEKARPAEPLSIVVLPFANIGGDPAQEYFVDGVTESLTTDLSRIAGLFVIARNTAFTYKGKPVDVKQIGRELNVRYVLEGSVRRGGNRLRVNVQLVEAGTGNHLWAERFDTPIGDLFEMQDEIVAHLANQLGAELVALEARRVEKALNPDSMDLYFQGQSWLNRGTTSDLLGRARDFFERALVLDPGNISASVGVAATDCIVGGAHLTNNQLSRLTAAEAWLTRTLSLAPNNAQAHFWLGNVFVFTKRADQGIAEFERALALDRNLANAHAFIGFAKAVVGRPAETEGHVQEAIRLSPRDTLLDVWTHCIAFAKFALGAEAEAVVWYRRVIEINRHIPLSHFLLAAALARLGQFDEAKAAVLVGLTLDPRFTIRRYRAGEWDDNPNYLAQRQRLIDGMRKAGVPEG